MLYMPSKDAMLEVQKRICLTSKYDRSQDANRMPSLTYVSTYIQIPVQTLMDSKDPEEGIPLCDKKSNCVKRRHDGEHRSQTQERTLHPCTNLALTATERG